MKRKIFLTATLFLFILFSVTYAKVEKVEADKNESSIAYHLHHPMHEVDGVSKQVYCQVEVDDSSHRIRAVLVTVDVTTFNSGNSDRDDHAMEVIDALDYPDVKIQSDSVSYLSDTNITVSGRLTFHGVSEAITLPVSISPMGDKTACDGDFDISLTKFKVERPSLLFIPVDDKLHIKFHIVFDQRL